MKNYKFVFAIVAGLLFSFSSCTNDDYVDEITNEVVSEKPKLKSAGDGRYDLLGYGYDITKEYLGSKSSKAAVVDLEKFLRSSAVNRSRLDSITTTEFKSEYYYGANSDDYIKEINNKTVLSATANNKSNLNLFKKIVGFTATLDTENEFKSKYSYSNKYSFAQYEKVIKVKSLMLYSYPDTLSSYLSAAFLNDLRTRTPEEIINTYGTHVLLDFSIGGRLYATYNSVYHEDSRYENKRLQVKAGLNVSLLSIGLNADATVERQTIITQNTKNVVQNLRVRTIGGSKAIDKTYDMVNNNPAVLNTTDWENSVYENKGKNAALVDINWSKTFPIYDFITDPVKKQQIKIAVENYIKSKQLEMLDIGVPLNRYYNGVEHFYEAEPQRVIGGRYTFERVECYIFPNQVPGSLPLNRYYNGINHYYETGVRRYIKNYVFERVEGYVFKERQPGMIPLRRYHNWTDHFYEATELIPSRDPWWYQGLECYVYPAK